MSERTRERTDDDALEDLDVDVGGSTTGTDSVDVDAFDDGPGVDLGSGIEDATAPVDAERESGGSGLRDRLSSSLDPRSYLLGLGAGLAGVFVVGDLIPLLPFDGFLGVLLMTLLLGLLSGKRRYLPSAVGGAVAGGLGLFLSSITISIVTGGLPIALGAAVGAAAGLVGHYAGRDVRDGLTRDL